MFSCEFFEIFKNTLFTEHLRTTASAVYRVYVENRLILEPNTLLMARNVKLLPGTILIIFHS